MGFNPEIYEMSDYFAGDPCVYLPNLPRKAYMRLFVLRKARAARRKPCEVSLKLVRPLNEESGFMAIREMTPGDHAHVLQELQEHFGRKNLVVENLVLRFAGHVGAASPIQDPYDIVEANFTIRKK